MTGSLQAVQKILTTEQLLDLQKKAKVYVDPALMEYAVRMVTATRKPKGGRLPDLERYIMFGASPRASINLILTAGRWPLCAGATTCCRRMCWIWRFDVMRHRIVLTYEALSDNVTGDDMLNRIPRPHPDPGGAAA
jgi:MoxR-like ATPase